MDPAPEDGAGGEEPRKEDPDPCPPPAGWDPALWKKKRAAIQKFLLHLKAMCLDKINQRPGDTQWRNRLITKSYADLYKKNPDILAYSGLAAHASRIVGRIIQGGHVAPAAGKGKIAPEAQRAAGKMGKAFEETNLAVFQDLYWPHALLASDAPLAELLDPSDQEGWPPEFYLMSGFDFLKEINRHCLMPKDLFEALEFLDQARTLFQDSALAENGSKEQKDLLASARLAAKAGLMMTLQREQEVVIQKLGFPDDSEVDDAWQKLSDKGWITPPFDGPKGFKEYFDDLPDDNLDKSSYGKLHRKPNYSNLNDRLIWIFKDIVPAWFRAKGWYDGSSDKTLKWVDGISEGMAGDLGKDWVDLIR